MGQVLLRGRQALAVVMSVVSLLWFRLWPTVADPAVLWFNYFVHHKDSIVMLATINTALTAVSELGSRTILPKVQGDPTESFIVAAADGTHHIHRQSAINICMTLMASLLGGPVYFISSRRSRFLFFISFGSFNSYISQAFSTAIMTGFISISLKRLGFDFFYNASIKFFMFEYVRPYLIRHKGQPFMVLGFRVAQDFLTTLVRVVILSWINLKGS